VDADKRFSSLPLFCYTFFLMPPGYKNIEAALSNPINENIQTRFCKACLQYYKVTQNQNHFSDLRQHICVTRLLAAKVSKKFVYDNAEALELPYRTLIKSASGESALAAARASGVRFILNQSVSTYD
jgi:hypothetical protein